MDIGAKVLLMGVHSTTRVACNDMECPLEHSNGKMGRVHYEDAEPTGLPGQIVGYDSFAVRPGPAPSESGFDEFDNKVVGICHREPDGRRFDILLESGTLAHADVTDLIDPGKLDEFLKSLRDERGGSAPGFAATIGSESAAVVTANTNRDGTGTIATVCTAGSSGTRIEEIVAKCDGDPADSTLVFYKYDGSAYLVWDEWDIGNPAAGSTTVASYREMRKYENLLLPSSWSLRASITVALTAGQFQINAEAGDF